MEAWRSESNPGKQMVIAIVSVAVGTALSIGFRGFAGSGTGNGRAGFLLGLLLLLIGLAGLLTLARQTVVVDPMTRIITIENKGIFGAKRRQISFADVTRISIGFLGKKSNFVTSYYLVLKLKDGTDYSLFSRGQFYTGASDRPTVEGWRQRLEDLMRT